MLSAEVAIYPENTNRGDEIVNRSIQSVKNIGIDCNVDHMSTRLSGDEDQIWAGLQKMCQEAANSGEFSMVVTLTNH
ncbi:MAG: hypothetical protein PWR10_2016 [Halanaerobiales bacterium]|nr:hypothetical protein [Halanaerobiales bacterium]